MAKYMIRCNSIPLVIEDRSHVNSSLDFNAIFLKEKNLKNSRINNTKNNFYVNSDMRL
jgi:hypothetical protein